jgi:hypothetical protein
VAAAGTTAAAPLGEGGNGKGRSDENLRGLHVDDSTTGLGKDVSRLCESGKLLAERASVSKLVVQTSDDEDGDDEVLNKGVQGAGLLPIYSVKPDQGHPFLFTRKCRNTT